MTARLPKAEAHGRITAADITVGILLGLGVAGVFVCVAAALGAFQ